MAGMGQEAKATWGQEMIRGGANCPVPPRQPQTFTFREFSKRRNETIRFRSVLIVLTPAPYVLPSCSLRLFLILKPA
jgi:hypothetical protein